MVFNTYSHWIQAAFPPWIIKTMEMEAVYHFGSSNHKKITENTPVPKMDDPKIDKNGHLDLKILVVCVSPAPLDHQINGHSGHQKWSLKVTKMSFWGIKSCPFGRQPVSS